MKRLFSNDTGKFLVLVLVFFVLTSPILVLFGPFDNIKRTVVGAIYRSRHPHYITWLYNESEINQILGGISSVPRQEFFDFKARTDTSLKMQKIEAERFTGFLLEVPDPKRLQVATAENIREIGDTTSNIARKNGAVAAVNAGGFDDPNGTGTGRLPYGLVMHDGTYLIGDQVDDVEINDFIGFTKDGHLVAGKYNKAELREMEVREGITFGPPLIVNGEKMITSGDGGWGVGPRTAIGQRKDGTVLLLVIDGRQPAYSIGATLRDVQDILYEQGAYIAANLDGGSSSTMYLNGQVVNKPADLLGERMIPTAWVVK